MTHGQNVHHNFFSIVGNIELQIYYPRNSEESVGLQNKKKVVHSFEDELESQLYINMKRITEQICQKVCCLC